MLTDEPLPDFTAPPVNETAISIQFAPIVNFGVPHYGLYWKLLRDEFPNYQVHPPIVNVTEQFDVPARAPRLGLQLVMQPEMRCWYLDVSGNRLLQLQNDRFVQNWRQVSGTETYPRFPKIREMCLTEWNRFCDFLKQEHLSQPQVTQCEVTYVNHIEYGKGWDGYGDLSSVISPWSGNASGNFLPNPEQVNMEAHYRLPSDLGRLHISVEPVVRVRDSKEVLQMTLTARGAPKSSSQEDVFEWIDLGRKWVVKGFSDFTAARIHAFWGKVL
jgi:uncharacterized protein (TIGR04255 family)